MDLVNALSNLKTPRSLVLQTRNLITTPRIFLDSPLNSPRTFNLQFRNLLRNLSDTLKRMIRKLLRRITSNLLRIARSAEENLPLEFTHGTKRRRQILSDSESSSTPDEDADSATPTAMTPADPTAATTVPFQGTVAQIIFGTAAPTTSIVSNKAINRRTANDYAGTRSGMVFSCPVTGCEQPINEAWTVEKFYKHLEDPLHTECFYQRKSHLCHLAAKKVS